ncbi:traB domain-containing protein isoform X5 [Papio anubis]|uniref:traB domain-containing protein isoform X5 n=1 Tax=Papio anubis TaxID=9555 RepID=UPI000B7B2F64|nr:traB domain-containing protein isoform X5 [Papio anubis]
MGHSQGSGPDLPWACAGCEQLPGAAWPPGLCCPSVGSISTRGHPCGPSWPARPGAVGLRLWLLKMWVAWRLHQRQCCAGLSRQNGLMSGLMQMLLLKVSAHITEQLGMAPGGEFREAFKEASKVPFCKFHLGDRPIPVTFKRAIAALSFWQKVRLAWGLCFLSDPISHPLHSKDDVERCKQKDLLEQMMAEMIGEFPDLHRTIVSERDVYLTYMLRQAARRLELPRASDAEPRKCVPSVVVGVVGMGHVPGIEKNWSTDLNIQEIMTVPPPSVSGRVSRLAVKAAFFGLLGYSLYWMGRRTASLVLSLPAAQYCLQRVTEARHK